MKRRTRRRSSLESVIHNVAGRMLHGKVIGKLYVSLTITESYQDDYPLFKPLTGNNPLVTTIGQTKGHYILWSSECVRLYAAMWVWSEFFRPMLIFRHLTLWSLVHVIVSSDLWNIHDLLLHKYDLVFEHHNHVCMTAFCRWLYYGLQCIS
jgi:hypothetical protein